MHMIYDRGVTQTDPKSMDFVSAKKVTAYGKKISPTPAHACPKDREALHTKTNLQTYTRPSRLDPHGPSACDSTPLSQLDVRRREGSGSSRSHQKGVPSMWWSSSSSPSSSSSSSSPSESVGYSVSIARMARMACINCMPLRSAEPPPLPPRHCRCR